MRSSFLVLLLAAAAFLALAVSCEEDIGGGDNDDAAAAPPSLDELRPQLSQWMRDFLAQHTITGLYQLIRSPAHQDADQEYAMAVLANPAAAPQEAFNVLLWARVLGHDILAFQAIEYFLNYYKHVEDPSALEEALAVASIRSATELLSLGRDNVISDELRQRLWKAVWDALEADRCGGIVAARAAHALASVVPGLYSDFDRPLIEQQLPFAQALLDNDLCSDSVMRNAAYMHKMLTYGRENLDRWQAQGVHADISLARYRDLIVGGQLFDSRYANSVQTCANKDEWDSNPFCALSRAYQQSEFASERVVQQSKLTFPPLPNLSDVEMFSSRAFRAADTDGNRALSVAEFAGVVGDKCSHEAIKSAIQTVYGGTRQSVERSMFFVVGNSCMSLTSAKAAGGKAEL